MEKLNDVIVCSLLGLGLLFHLVTSTNKNLAKVKAPKKKKK